MKFRPSPTLVSLSLAAALSAMPLLASAAADAGNANPKADTNARNQLLNGRSAFKGNLTTGQHIYYVGDDLDISVKFSRGADLLLGGDADAHIVIFTHDTSLISVPVDDGIGTNPRRFFDIDDISTSQLPEGQYQLALVLTIEGGDPTILDDWYGGFRALLDVENVYVSDAPLDGDNDADGEWDDDDDGDGIHGEEGDDEDDD